MHFLEDIMKKTAILIYTLLFTAFFALQSVSAQVQNTMVKIQGGTFTMGSPEGEQGRNREDEGPQHQVTLSPFLISKFPITQAEYEQIMGTNPSNFIAPNLPVEKVSWINAVDYCNRRSTAEGLTPVYTINGNNVTWDRTANGYRLPTEAEWEYACRAGTQTPYYTGDTVDEAGWHSGNSRTGYQYNQTHPVGEKLPNAWGLYDMHGNVYEWCWDWFGNYTADPVKDPAGPATGRRRVYRGGGWVFGALMTRSAHRAGQHQNFVFYATGFRVARSE